MKDKIQYGSATISYSLEYKDRKTLGITVNPEMEVLVKAPKNSSLEKIRQKVRKRADWILKQQSYFLSFHPKITKRKYVSGESHLYLGRKYLLKVKDEDFNSVKYKGSSIEVSTKNRDNVCKLLNDWYREKANIKFLEIAQPLIERFQKYNVEPSEVRTQEMPKRWGSCTPKGKIILNPELIKAPKASIEYVIVHELCHLVERDHNQAFFELQTKEMPDWKKWKNKLENLLA